MSKLLDYDGLSYYHGKVQGKISQLRQEVTADVSQLEAEVNGSDTLVTIDLSTLDPVQVAIKSDTKKWGVSNVYYGGFFPVTPGQTVKITKGTISSYFTVLQNTNHTIGTTPSYATGYDSRIDVTEDKEFVVPDNGAYIFVMITTSSGTVDDTYQKRAITEGLTERVDTLEEDYTSLGGRVGDLEEAITPIGSDVESLKDDVGDIEDDLNGTEEETLIPLDFSDYTEIAFYIYSATNMWRDNVNSGSILIPVSPGEKYRLIAPNDKKGTFAVMKTDAHLSGSTAKYSDTYPGLISVVQGQTQDITIPQDGNYLYVLVKSASSGAVNSSASKVVTTGEKGLIAKVSDLEEQVAELENIQPGTSVTELQQLFDSLPIAVDANGWELPTTAGMVYALKKAAQASQIVYNALAAYPNLSSATGAYAGEHTGFPYSSTKEIRKFIGWEVSFRTFMTAVQNLYGMFYTEDISSAHGQSGYGYTYDGTNCGPFYGMVCSILTGYALGWDIPYDTDQFAYLARKGVLVKVSDQTPQGVHICDLIWYQGHTALVTGVQRDQWGNVINVQITESLGAVHSTSFTAAQFETYLHITHNAIIYRPTKVYENTYEPSEFVAVRGESTPTPYVYNYDICHYAGDYSAMRSDQPTWINYTLGNYTGMKIYKGDTLLTTITPDGSLHKVDVSSYMTGAGKYSACLTDGVNDSEATHWQIVDAGCTYEDTGAKQKITFASSNGTPWWVQVCSSRGVAYCWYKPTQDDIANGYCELDLASMIAEQYTGTPASTTYVRIMYKADYGGVVSAMVQR